VLEEEAIQAWLFKVLLELLEQLTLEAVEAVEIVAVLQDLVSGG
tara:strand:- start:105 stop:236 length:132 start_codon:yes stop_codon:yes gene_type:complete